MSGTVARQLLPRQSTTPTTGGDGSTGEQLLKLVSNPFQASLQTNAFWASLGIYLGTSAILAVLFSVVRPRHRVVYAPKTKHADEQHAPPPMGNGLFAWIGPVMKTKEPVLLDKIGMDAVVFLRFTRMLRNMFLALGLIGLCIMIPVNVSLGNKSISGGGSGFAVMTPLYVFGSGLWAQVVVAWATNLIVCYFLWYNYRKIHQLRRSFFASPDYQLSLHARTVMIRDIPSQLRTDDGIMRITDAVNPTGVAPRTALGRNVKALPELIEEHEESVRELETVLAKYFKNPDKLPPRRPTMKAAKKYGGQASGGNVDAIEYLTERIRVLELQINEYRDRVDAREPLSYGFASWDQIDEAHAVAYAGRKKKPQGASIKLAPRPSDLLWKNLPLGKASRKSKMMIHGFWLAVLTVLWLPLNAGIAIFLSNLSNLGSVWPAFQRQLEAHHTGWAIVQGVAAPSITSLVYLVLPIIFRRLQIRAGDHTKTQREQHVLRNLYIFFTLNNLVLFSIFSAIWQYVTVVIQNNNSGLSTWDALKKGQFFLTVTTALCQISPFWVSFILQRNLGAAIDIAQLWPLIVMWFERTFMSPTPRQNIEWTAPQPFTYASYYNYFLFYATIALCFSTLQPLVLLVTALYFSFDAILKKYLLMYVFITKNESGGVFWKTLFNRLVFATILSDVVIGVVVKARGTWYMVAALVPLLAVMGALKWYCARTFDAEIKYYTRTGMLDGEAQGGVVKRSQTEKISTKYGHPALYKPLMTPMVSGKARHLLGEIYHGRLSTEVDDVRASQYADIAMQPINQPVKPPDAPFEVVSEAQQDFKYYKNRDDFREEGGDLYGRPEDVMTERSQTPMSFMSMNKAAGDGYFKDDSRAGSPARDGKPMPQIRRKDVGGAYHPPTYSANESRESSLNRVETRGTSDLGVRHGLYTDPYDDRANLLGGAGDVRTPNGQFMSMDRWQSGSTPTPGYEQGGSYDYFRAPRGRRQ